VITVVLGFTVEEMIYVLESQEDDDLIETIVGLLQKKKNTEFASKLLGRMVYFTDNNAKTEKEEWWVGMDKDD